MKPNIEIPSFLFEMSSLLHTQNNRMTSHPMFEVRYKHALTCAEDRGDFWIICDTNNEYAEIYNSDEMNNQYFFTYMKEYYEEWVLEWEENTEEPFGEECFDIESDLDALPTGYEQLEVLHMQTLDKTLRSFFTEKEAFDFIRRRGHKYKGLFTYAISMHDCPQMIQLREWIMSLTNEPGEENE